MKTSNQAMHPLHGISPDDAVDLLIADHKRVANLFADFKRLAAAGDEKKKAAVVQQICQELTVHTQLEEELFYPAVRAATEAEDQVDEALVEHAGAKVLIAQLQGALPDEELYDARVTVLGEQIDHHVEEEEGSMFPKARHATLDMRALGAQLLARKAELQGAPARKPVPAQESPGGQGAEGDEEESPRKNAQPTPKKKAVVAKSRSVKAKAKRR